MASHTFYPLFGSLIMAKVYVAGPAAAAAKNQYSIMTNDLTEVEAFVAANPGAVFKEVPPQNLKPRRRKRRG